MEPTEQPPQPTEAYDIKMLVRSDRKGQKSERCFYVTQTTSDTLLKTLDDPYIEIGRGLSYEKRMHIGFKHAFGTEWLPLEDVIGIRFQAKKNEEQESIELKGSSALVDKMWECATVIQQGFESVPEVLQDPGIQMIMGLISDLEKLRQQLNPVQTKEMSKA